jgi:uncharacterized protein YdbL (DUF1318 family)
MRTFLTFIILLTTFISLGIQASPLDDARAAGQIIETSDGYIRAQKGAPSDISTLVTDINARRQEAYTKIAKKNGLTVKRVGEESYKKRVAN